MPKSIVKVNPHLDDEFNKVLHDIEAFTDEQLEKVAIAVRDEARASTAFQDYRGTSREPASAAAKRKGNFKNLRKHIKHWWSKKEQVWMVSASQPHAHLVEFGHVQVTPKGKVTGHTPAHPFLRPAVEKVASRVKSILGIKG